MLIQISPWSNSLNESHWRLSLHEMWTLHVDSACRRCLSTVLANGTCQWDSLRPVDETGRWRSSPGRWDRILNTLSRPVFRLCDFQHQEVFRKRKFFETNLSVFINFNLQMIKKWLRFLTCNDKCWREGKLLCTSEWVLRRFRVE